MDSNAMRSLVNKLTRTGSKKVFVISGAPGSGKSTYVQKAKKNGDLVVDLDLIASALQGSTERHPDFEPVMDAVLATRDAIYKTIENRKGKWNNAYVITSNPSDLFVTALAGKLSAEVVKMDTSLEECKNRIQNDTSRREPEKDVSLVDKWFSKNTEEVE